MSGRLLLSILLASLALAASNAGAVQILPTPHASENDLTDILAATGYSHAGSFAELNANQSSADTFSPLGGFSGVKLIIEDAGYRDSNELGIYSLFDNTLTAVLFDGTDSAPDWASLVFGATGLDSVNGSAVATDFGSEFGFYLKNEQEAFTWYSQTERNSDGYEHFVAFEENGKMWGGFEDLSGGGDEDFNDLVFKMRGVAGRGAPAMPEPTAALLFGAGLVVVAHSNRRTRKQS
jgi:hypothetical protein